MCAPLLAGNIGNGQLLEALTTENSWLDFRVCARAWSAAVLGLDGLHYAESCMSVHLADAKTFHQALPAF